MVKFIASILLANAFFVIASACSRCPADDRTESNALDELGKILLSILFYKMSNLLLDFILGYLGMNGDDATKDIIISNYKQFVSALFCANSTSSCQEDQNEVFLKFMIETYTLMGLSEEAISEDLLNATKSLYDNLANVCSLDCSSVKVSSYEDLVSQMGALLTSLGCQPTDDLNRAAVNVIEARVVAATCDLGCA